MKIVPERTEEFVGSVLEKYADTVYRLALARTGRKENAEDIAQDVFLTLMECKEEFESEEHLKAWLLRVTVNRCHKLFASAWFRKTVPLSEELSFETPEEGGLWEQILSLSKSDRTILCLYYYENYNLLEIAGMLHQKEPTVRSRLFRARKRLKKKLGGADNEG